MTRHPPRKLRPKKWGTADKADGFGQKRRPCSRRAAKSSDDASHHDLEHREKGKCDAPSGTQHEAKYFAAARSLWMLGRMKREIASVQTHFGADGQGSPRLRGGSARYADHCEGLGFDSELSRFGGWARNSKLERVKKWSPVLLH